MEVSCTDDTVLSGPEYHYKKSGTLLAKMPEWDESRRRSVKGACSS